MIDWLHNQTSEVIVLDVNLTLGWLYIENKNIAL